MNKTIIFYINTIISSFISVTTCCFTLSYLRSAEKNSISAPAKVVSVYDGDTVTVEFKIKMNVRLLDCYAPEVKGPEKENGLKSKEFLQSLVKAGDDVTIEIPMGDNLSDSISLSRVLAYVKKDLDNDGELENISEEMVKSGYAKEKK